MKLRVSHAGETRDVEVVRGGDGRISLVLDGAPVEAEVHRVDGGLLLRLGARVYDLAVGGPPEELQVVAGEVRAVLEVESPSVPGGAPRRSRLGAGDREVRASMPGRVVKLLVGPGDAVEAGAPLVVVEAMKMENELRAPGPGTVAAIHVEVGASVEARALLVSLDPP
ncbi:MAG: biotin/lipoyl-containing protein [Sandaracinaceae bacterium]